MRYDWYLIRTVLKKRECVAGYLFFIPILIHPSTPSGPLINWLKYFQILFVFYENVTVCKTPRSPTSHEIFQWAGLRGILLLGGLDTAESSSTVSRRSRSQTSHWAEQNTSDFTMGITEHRSVRIHSGQNTAESDSAVYCTVYTLQSQTSQWAEHRVRIC